MSNRAWVTLATNDSYGLGALVLAHSLRRTNSAYPAAVLITPAVTDAMRDRLAAVFAEVITVDVLDSKDAAHLALLQRPELGITFTKIHCWNLTQYEKCVFLDADTLVVQNSDELFDREELSAAPDVGWPDCFNSGVFVFKPSKETFDALIKFAKERGSFDGGDQGLLNSFFSDWARGDINKHLPFLYNVTSAAFYSYLPAFKHFGQDLKIIHFIGVAKPWLQNFNWDTQSVDSPDHLKGTLQLWWDIFVDSVHQQLNANMVEESSTEVELPEDTLEYYKPKVDPESEFPWHHADPEAIKEDDTSEKIDLSQFHDPWAHYKGNIPLHPDQHPQPDDPNISMVAITQELRDYIWEYKQAQDEHTHAQVEPHSQTHHSHDAHWEPSHHDHQHPHDMRQSGYQRHEHSHHHIDHHHNRESSWSWQMDVQVNSHNHSLHDHTPHALHTHEHHKEEKTQVYHVEVKTERKRLRRPRTTTKSRALINNGDLSGSESDQSDVDVFVPRHPYDGFYLRHRATFDARGRKMCTHEVPLSMPAPSPPPSPLPQIVEEPADQTGVAGVLARVAGPGAAGSDRGAAIDELTRRQGWEQGNIDYMGADSFDNIWAKISQTLSQAPSKEPSPPKDVKQPSPPKEVAPETAPELPAPLEQPAPIEQTAPVEQAPAPTEQGTPASSEPVPEPVPAPIDPAATKTQGSEPAAVEQAAPAEATPTPVEPATPAEQGTPAPSEPVPEQSATTENQPSPPKEIESSVTESVPVASESAVVVSDEEAKEAPAVPPTPPATPKSTPEPSTPVTESLPVEVGPEAPLVTEAPVVPVTETPVAATAAPADSSAAPVEAAVAVASVAEETSASAAIKAEAPATPAVETQAPVSPAVEAQAPLSPVVAVETPASPTLAHEAPSSPAVASEALAESALAPSVATPEKSLDLTGSATDSPPLAHTPGKEEQSVSPAKSGAGGERARKPAGKLTLSPPAAADALPTPDSELEDAASLAQSIIAGELAVAAPTLAPATPALAPPTPATPALPASPPVPAEPARLAAAAPAPLDTPPAGPVSLAQIGVKTKPTTAAQIESSLADATPPSAAAASGTPKKKVVKKVVKKDAAATGAAAAAAGGDAPVPPPRKKEKKPKDK